jgi:diketogulonate reductase-like aldo/keto reductase
LNLTEPPLERAIEQGVLPYCRDHGLAMLAYGSLFRGLLSGKMTGSSRFTGDDLRKNDPKFQPPRFAQYLAAVAALDHFARENYGKRVIDLAVRWVLDRGDTNVALWARGGRISSTMGGHIDAAGMADINRILRDTITSPVGPDGTARPTRGSLNAACDLEAED